MKDSRNTGTIVVSAAVLLGAVILWMSLLENNAPTLYWVFALAPVAVAAFVMYLTLRVPTITEWFDTGTGRLEVRSRGEVRRGQWKWVRVRPYDRNGEPAWNTGTGWERKLASINGDKLVLSDNSRAAR